MAFSMAVVELDEVTVESHASDDEVLSWGSENDSDGTEWEELECISTASSYEILSEDDGESCSASVERSKAVQDTSKDSGRPHNFVSPALRAALEQRHLPVAFYTLRCGPHAMPHASRFGWKPFPAHWPHWPLIVHSTNASPAGQ
eukprot:GGOE01007562.1.p2 GENE.GGOE01007562.1~~GGOE01007562.1.p2  ORF type:complete len:145 (-),score=24.71 GGOE01007562.1:1159-1593(-)